MRATSVARLRFGMILIAMIVSLFAVRLLQLQGVDAATYAAKARAVGVVEEVLPATRGTITDRNGTPLAESLDGLMLVADPTKTAKYAPQIATIVARRLDEDYFKLLAALRKPDTQFQYLARRVPSGVATELVADLAAQGYKGIDTRRDPLRTYPARDVAANVIGFTNAEGQAGEGAELMFDRLLSGTDGSATFEVGGGNRIPLGDNSVVEPKDGTDLTLTIDQDAQWYAQRVLRDTVQRSGGESGSAVALDVRTGEVLALADFPTFDANRPTEAPQENLGARSVRDVYEPGSVQKVLTLATLLDAGHVTPRTRLVVPESIRSSDRRIGDWFDHGTIRLTLTGVLAKSSNIGTVLAARDFPDEALHEGLAAFGLGSSTGLGMNGEAPGILTPWSGWREINKDNIAFGQGLAVNVVQMAAAVGTIANGGVYVQPSLVKGKATMNDGTVVGSDVAETRQVISPEAARKTALMMEAVVDPERGTAPSAAIEGYRVAGKTGTAQRVGEKCGCYDGSKTLSFAGFAPADAPRFLVYVVVHDPVGGGGGTVGGPAFHKIMSFLLSKYGVPPTGVKESKLPVEWTRKR